MARIPHLISLDRFDEEEVPHYPLQETTCSKKGKL